MEIERDTLVSLPEACLIIMFPNGLILGRNNMGDGEYDDDEEDAGSDDSMSEDQVIYVDFDPACLEYVLQFYELAQKAFAEGRSPQTTPISQLAAAQNPLLNKQAIIVLREELDFFSIPPKTDASNEDTEELLHYSTDMYALKTECGQYLLNQRKIFTALQRNINKENNLAEQHLIDMLCVSGFSREDEWGYRAVEPAKTSIVSIGLVMLKTTGNGGQMATAQKLLLFWRKPARKCWWDGQEVIIGSKQTIPVRLWARRTWTLELALV